MGIPLPTPEPLQFDYVRWQHKERGYVVRLINQLSYRGAHGYITVVHVSRKGHRMVRWPGVVFLATFKPLGRKRRLYSRLDRID